MKKILLYGCKLITNISITTILYFFDTFDYRYAFIILLAMISNALPIFILLKRRIEYRKRYVRKKYKMSVLVTFLYNFVDIFLICLFYFIIRTTANIIWYFVIHLTISLLLASVLLNFNPKKILKRNKITEKYNFEYGVIRGKVLVDNQSVLEEGEKVQVLEKFNESVLVRKGNGDEYSINMDMIAIRSYKR